MLEWSSDVRVEVFLSQRYSLDSGGPDVLLCLDVRSAGPFLSVPALLAQAPPLDSTLS